MKLNIRTQISGLVTVAVLVPVLVILGLTIVKKGQVGHVVVEGIDKLAVQTLDQAALDMYHLYDAVDEVVENDSLAIEKVQEQLKEIKIGETGYLFAIAGSGADRGVMVMHPVEEQRGKSFWNTKDNEGNLFFQTMASGAMSAGRGETAVIHYDWKNPGDMVARAKLASAVYYEPWNLVIGASAYLDEFQTVHKGAQAALGSLVTIIVIVGLIMLAASVTFAMIFGRVMGKNIQFIAEGARHFAVGDIALEDMDHSKIAKMNNRSDEIGEIGRAFVELIEYLKSRADAADQIAHGNFDIEIHTASDHDVLSQSMLAMRDNIEKVIKEMMRVSEVFAKDGDIEIRPDASIATGSYRELLEIFNGLMEGFVKDMLTVLELIGDYAKGKLDNEAPVLPGKKIVLTEAINGIRSNLLALIDEGMMLTEAAEQGDLKKRGDTSKFEGGYRKIIGGFNNTIEKILEPVNEAVEVLKDMANSDLTTKVSGQYKGDHAVMKNALNTTVDSLNDVLSQVNVAVEQVNSGSQQVSDSSQSLSQGATEQASSLEEVTSSITQIGSQTKQNAENATQANQLANTARGAADKGNAQMQQMLGAMNEITESSNEISKIIKVIDEIAFQTNLLALNAAVEAARAGVHGKGFAVVADEVRNLAQRSAQAAKETTALIEGTVQRVENGSSIADETAEALTEIITGVTKVNDLVGEIASASNEQTVGINQIGDALTQIDSVTQANTSNAEEGASAAEELSSQATHLKQMVSRFNLTSTGASIAPAERRLEPVSTGNGNGNGWDKKALPAKKTAEAVVGPEDVINLEDSDFEDF